MVRKFLAVVVLSGLSLVACSPKSNPTPRTTFTSPPTSVTTGTYPPVTFPTTDTESGNGFTQQEQVLLQTLHTSQYSTVFSTTPNATLVATGHDFCTQLESGATVKQITDQLLAALSNTGASETVYSATGYYFGASIAAFCPEYVPQLSE